MNIFYNLGDNVYVNITNKCSCACVFCIRNNADGISETETLWLDHEPSFEEIKSAFNAYDFTDKKEVVFCGYGEPMERAETVIETAKYIKTKLALPLRLNTNGLVKLINPDFDLSALKIFEAVSISLNAANAEAYNSITRPRFGKEAFNVMLDFASQAKKFTSVGFTVVSYSEISEISKLLNIDKCRELAENLGIPLRVRGRVTNNENYE